MKKDSEDYNTSLAVSSFSRHLRLKAGLSTESIGRCPQTLQDGSVCGTTLPWKRDGSFGLHCVACTLRALNSADEDSEEMKTAEIAAQKERERLEAAKRKRMLEMMED